MSFQFLKQVCASCRPIQNIMQKRGKNRIVQINLKCVGCEEMGNAKIFLSTPVISPFVVFTVIDKQ